MAEILFALALLALLLVLALGILQWALRGSVRCQEETRAAFMAQARMEELFRNPKPGSGESADGFSWKATVDRQDGLLHLCVSVGGPRGGQFMLQAQHRLSNREVLVHERSGGWLGTAEDAYDSDQPPLPLSDDFSLSPDGRTLAYVDGGKLLLLDVASGKTTLLLADVMNPRFSPDGRRLAFVRDDAVCVYDLGRRLQDTWSRGQQDASPAWTPDGKGLLVSRASSSIVLLTQNSTSVLVEDTGCWNTAPALSPDGNRLAFMSNRAGNPEIYIMDLHTHTCLRLTQDAAYDSDPTFSGDGKRLLYVSTQSDGSGRLFSINLDGSRAVQLSPRTDVSRATWCP